MKSLNFVAWILFASFPRRCAPQNITYVRRREGESVDISCVPEEELRPFGLYLRYGFPEPERDVAFFSASRHTTGRRYRDRVSIRGKVDTGPVSVTVSSLQRNDTGLYVCSFSNGSSPLGQAEHKSTAVFVFVETRGGRCACPQYPVLLYTISAMVAMLLLIVIVMGYAKLFHGKLCSCKEEIQEIIPVPIYEEMTRKQPVRSGDDQPVPGDESSANSENTAGV
uniref:Ig-like domain-containing protein n=1 Tax=Scleropages formosus TaxID=113540 RepID=A0A8C9R1Y3_SCLFO